MKHKKGGFPVRLLVRCALTAALYASLTMVLAPISFGPVQFRISEAMCILPLFFPEAVIGLFVGCITANFMTPNIPFLDVVFGSAATLAAAAVTAAMRPRRRKKEENESSAIYKIPLAVKLLAPLPAVLINAVVIGAVITFSMMSFGASGFAAAFVLNCLSVGAGQAVVCYALGVPLIYIIEKIYGTLNKRMDIYDG